MWPEREQVLPLAEGGERGGGGRTKEPPGRAGPHHPPGVLHASGNTPGVIQLEQPYVLWCFRGTVSAHSVYLVPAKLKTEASTPGSVATLATAENNSASTYSNFQFSTSGSSAHRCISLPQRFIATRDTDSAHSIDSSVENKCELKIKNSQTLENLRQKWIKNCVIDQSFGEYTF